MRTDSNLQFIRKKINSLRNAIMYSVCGENTNLPTSIVRAVKVDEEGNLWFLCNKPANLTDGCPSAFPVRLHFYRKGIFYHMEVSGKASIINNAYKGNNEADKPLLIKMSMTHIEYTETEPVKKSWVEVSLEKIAQWAGFHMGIPDQSKPVLH